MAIMIPDTCPSRATVGEKRTFTVLQNVLPDNFTAWYEPVIQGRYPDFTLLGDTFGLLVLEVKGWYAKQITAVTDHDVELQRTDEGQVRVERFKNPIRQVREYLFGLMNELGRNEYVILRNEHGAHQGKLCFPCGYGVLLTNITRRQLEEAGLSAVFPPEQVICRDELADLEQAGDRETIRRLKQLFPVAFPFDPLTDDQIQTIKGVLHKEVVVRTRPATAASVRRGHALLPGAVALEVLDARQEQVARSLGEGHHVFFGVAGSGKTSLILSRARLVAGQDHGKKVLVLCFNRVLARYLAAQFDDRGLQNVEVRHFHSWAALKTGLRKRDDESFDEYQAQVVGTLLQGLEHWPEATKYDAILIDEAHDFDPDWFRCCVGLLKGGPEGDLLIAVDGAQSLYGRRGKFTWNSVGVQARGRTKRLSRNYRNTKEIMEFAWQVGQSLVPDDADTETHARVLPTHASRHGPTPVYSVCKTTAAERAAIVRLVEGYQARGIADREIAVLYPRKERSRIDELFRSLEAAGAVCWLSKEAEQPSGRNVLERPGLRLSTIHSAKGLEFRAVIVSALDQLPNPHQTDEVRDSNLLYVGLTRALEYLAVTWVGRSAFTDRVLRSTKVEPVPDPR